MPCCYSCMIFEVPESIQHDKNFKTLFLNSLQCLIQTLYFNAARPIRQKPKQRLNIFSYLNFLLGRYYISAHAVKNGYMLKKLSSNYFQFHLNCFLKQHKEFQFLKIFRVACKEISYFTFFPEVLHIIEKCVLKKIT